MQESIQKKFAVIIESMFAHSKTSFNTFPLVAAVALRAVSDDTGFIVVDVSGEATELTIVHDDGLRHIASFPIGYQSIARKTSTKEDAVGDAMSRLSLLARGELSEDEELRVRESFSNAFSEWGSSFDEVLHSASQNIPIPQAVYVLSDKAALSWIKIGFENNNTYSLNFVPVGAPLIQALVEVGEGAVYDMFLSLSALFFHIGKTDLIGEAKELDVVYSR